ncbi:DUF3592 domain-containing protein [Sulfuriroseicoccus oceanibius]|uniref:DUF3592 domain-containing protein n=1 Tax=Sulfuriroseicoccus oceanibius TaxID=2707525 RepID=A0A6B3L331_9BACT|nr:DUF3592 domain-containing protein [Sulfuriroseicoccus oceanibius]QQL45305.1 DUF3592 domain-containing protein [Sulfuriroseicoccus oceanibius]
MIKRTSTEPSSARNSNKSGFGCLFLFGLPFLLAGLFVMGLGVKSLWIGLAAADWPETQATLQRVELETHHGDDSVSYEVVAEYSYRWDGREYTNDRVGLTTGGDNFGDWQQRTYRELDGALRAGETVPCYVDPENPGDALLKRELRPRALMFYFMFGGVFALIGGGLGTSGLIGAARAKKRKAKLAQNPDQPWLLRDDWNAGVVKANERWEFAVLLGFAAFWNGISWTVFIAMLDELGSKPNMAWMVLLFPLIGIGLLVGVFRLWRRGRMLGQLEFRFDPELMPFEKGGQVVGTIVGSSPKLQYREDDLELGLVVERVVTSQRGNQSSTSTQVAYSHFEGGLDPTRGVRGTELPVRLVAPTGYEDTTIEGGAMIKFKANTDTHWRVRLQGKPKTALEKFKASFDVPVFGDAAHPVEAAVSDGVAGDSAAESGAALADEDLERLGVRRVASMDGTVTYMRTGKELRKFGFWMVAFAVVMMVVGAGIANDDAGAFGYLFCAGASLVGIVGIGMISARSALVVDPRAGTLTKIGQLLGIRRQKVISAAALQSVEPDSNTEVNGEPRYHLAIRSSEGNANALGWLKEHHLASRLAKQIEREVRA